ncbi:MAG: hypothetical protein NWS96_03510 [Pseudomonadales bacterium]|nr:hypothetical protein [Pseudomonadales bacterium]
MTVAYPGKTSKPMALLRHGGFMLLVLLLGACSDPGRSTAPAALSRVPLHIDLQAYHSLVDAQTRKSLIFAEALRLSTEQFLHTPDATQQAALQTAWLKAHNAFVAVLALAAIDQQAPLLFQIDAWPIEPGYLDSLPAYPDSGLISDVTLAITAESLREQHGFTDSQEVSLGFHAMEYLIFARSAADFLNLPGTTLSQPQPTAGTDGDQQQQGEGGEVDPAGAVATDVLSRRRQTLKILADLINQDLYQLVTGINTATTASSTATPANQLLAILTRSRHTSDRALAASQQLLTGEAGHGAFSSSSAEILQLTLRSLQQVFSSPADLGQALLPLAPKATADLLATLAQAQTLSGAPQPASEADHAQLTLLVAALPHHFDDLIAALNSHLAGH